MKKLNLVAMIDGTWNDYESGTNVRRLHDMIVQGRPYVIDGGDVQYVTRANYERGPGTSPDVKLTGGAFASDLARAIGHSYDWLATRAANAAPEEGEMQVWLFGFSRGAYSAHVLSWLLSEVGLPREVDLAKDLAEAYVKGDNKSLAQLAERAGCHPSPPVVFLGLWDAVTAPLDIRGNCHDGEVAPIVRCVRHAMAANERRILFDVMHYVSGMPEDFVQMWFPGVHGDAGGMYEDDRCLSDIALNWMACAAREHGLGLSPRPVEMSEYDFSGRQAHDEAWGETANRRFVEGDEFHDSIASLGRLDSDYRVDVSGLPEAIFSLFS